MTTDGSGITGEVTWVLTGPDGKVKSSGGDTPREPRP
jgi:hypothetical protein